MLSMPKEIAFSICMHEDEIMRSISEKSIDSYAYLKQALFQTDVSKDVVFQNTFRDYYIMFRCPAEFLDRYFAYMERQKNIPVYDFRVVSDDTYRASEGLCSKKGEQLKAKNNFSFTTKMLNLIYDKFPIYDTQVAQVFRYNRPTELKKQRTSEPKFIEYMLQTYHTIQSEHMIDSALEKFAKAFPQHKIPITKQIDFMLWKLGD